jgi:hypothetical protein
MKTPFKSRGYATRAAYPLPQAPGGRIATLQRSQARPQDHNYHALRHSHTRTVQTNSRTIKKAGQ